MDWKEAFEESLAQMLEAGDRRAVKRLVFYAVVQVGGSIPADSRLGKAAAAVLAPECQLSGADEGNPRYFAGDLFLWCRENGWRFESFPLLDEWTRRDFAQQVAIPMYLAVREQR